MGSRAEFEKWYLAQCVLNTVDKTPSGLASDDIYCKPATRRAWAAWQAGAAWQQSRLLDEELVERVAEAIKKDFPVVRTGTDENGNWCVNPLEDAIFGRAAQAALAEIKRHMGGGV